MLSIPRLSLAEAQLKRFAFRVVLNFGGRNDVVCRIISQIHAKARQMRRMTAT